MATYIEANANQDVRKRIPLRDAFIEAYPEETLVLSMIPKSTGKKPTSPTSSEVEWFFKTFRAGRNRPVYDGTDVDSSEYENNDNNKKLLKGRIQLIRSAVGIGRIAEVTQIQYGQNGNSRYKDNIADALRGMRADKELILCSNAASRNQGTSPVKTAYSTRGFAGWCTQATLADLPVDAAALIPANSIKTITTLATDWTEAALRALLQSRWDASKKKASWKMFCTSDAQTVMDDWLCFGAVTDSSEPIRRYNNEASTNSIELSVKSFSGSFGKTDMIPKHGLPLKFTDAGTVTTSGSATVTVTDNTIMSPGMRVSGTGIQAGSVILAVSLADTTTIVLDKTATASATVTGTFDRTVYAECMDMEFLELGYVDEVGWVDLENKGGGPRGYADALFFLANLNPQAHAIVEEA